MSIYSVSKLGYLTMQQKTIHCRFMANFYNKATHQADVQLQALWAANQLVTCDAAERYSLR